jgi:hypothetical protein
MCDPQTITRRLNAIGEAKKIRVSYVYENSKFKWAFYRGTTGTRVATCTRPGEAFRVLDRLMA